MSKVWLITGSFRGLGRDLAQAVLAAGHRLVAQRVHRLRWPGRLLRDAGRPYAHAEEDLSVYQSVELW